MPASRRDFLRFGIGGSLGLVALGTLDPQQAGAAVPKVGDTLIAAGDIFLTQVKNGERAFYGNFGHAALYVGNSEVIEGGIASRLSKALVWGTVVKTSLSNFDARYEAIRVYRIARDPANWTSRMCVFARSLIGKKPISCVDVLRESFLYATNRTVRAGWAVPDDIANATVFTYYHGKGGYKW